MSLARLLQERRDISFVALRWVDYCGHLRARVLTKEFALQLERTGETISSGLIHVTALPDNTPFPQHPATGIEYFTPDWQSATTFSYDDEHVYAAVPCDIVETLPDRPRVRSRCPRTVLRNMADALRHRNVLVGFEVEFNLLGGADDESPEATLGYSSASVLHTESFRVVQKCVEHLQRNNVSVLAFHAEGRGCQFEISTGPLPPLEAVDDLVRTLDIIRGVSARHGWRATMYPAPRGQSAGNGLHANISFSPVDDDEPQFVAGILNRLPVLLAFSMPSPGSYARLTRGACGSWVSWGTQNRDCPLRRIRPGRWEVRSFDATANPYLALAAYLAAGRAGVDRAEPLALPDCDRWVSDMDDRERAQVWRITAPLPASLPESLANLARDPMRLHEYLGRDIVERYARLKEFQLSHFAAKATDEMPDPLVEAY